MIQGLVWICEHALAVAHGVVYVAFGDVNGTGNLYTLTILNQDGHDNEQLIDGQE